MGLGIAIRAFSAALFDRQKSEQFGRLLAGETFAESRLSELPEATKPDAISQPATSMSPRDSAVTLLATLQREARLVDLLQEDLGQYSDAQVGAAARPCLQQCGAVLSRLFAVQPLVSAAEGSTIEVPGDATSQRYQWVGEGSARSAKLIHAGWKVDKVALPRWSGNPNDAMVIAPAQVQAS